MPPRTRSQKPRPLNVPELLDLTIYLLFERGKDSMSDLCACALVCRAWRCIAQSHLFSRIDGGLFRRIVTNPRSRGPSGARYLDASGTERMWKRLENTLNRSTHLIRHVREIGINHPLTRETFSRICSFPFSHLETVRIGGLGFDLSQSTLANSLQRLLQLPTLTYVDVRCGYSDPSVFLRIWDGFSPSIKHLKLLISDWSHDPPPPLLDPPSRITLVSLRIEDVDPGLQDWLTHDKSPFDFSSLKALSFGKFHKTDVMCWPQFSQAFKNIEALEFTAELVATPFDLSSFPQLALVSVRAQRVDLAIPIILATLRTISSTNCVHKIAIISPFPFDDSSPEQYAALDALLTNLPLRQSTVVELDTCFEDHVQYKAAFPRLVSKNMLRLKDYA